MIESGELRYRVHLLVSNPVRHPSSNEEVEVWSLWKTVWGMAYPRRGREAPEARERVASAVWRFHFRKQAVKGLDEKMLVAFDDRVYDIQVIMPDHESRDRVVVEAELVEGVQRKYLANGTVLNLWTDPILFDDADNWLYGHQADVLVER